MTTLAYTADDKNATWEIVAALLHLSNTVFGGQADASGEEGSKVDNPETIEMGAKKKPVKKRQAKKGAATEEKSLFVHSGCWGVQKPAGEDCFLDRQY